MNKRQTISILAILAVAVIAAIALKERKAPPAPPVITAPEAETETAPAPETDLAPKPAPAKPSSAAKPAAETKPAPVTKPEVKKKQLPRLLDLGADKCIPCKMMAPILDELKKEYAGKMDVEFIDVWKNRSAGDEYGLRVIPTQIFFDADGKEVFRHEGFLSKEDILAKWKEFGLNLTPAGK